MATPSSVNSVGTLRDAIEALDLDLVHRHSTSIEGDAGPYFVRRDVSVDDFN